MVVVGSAGGVLAVVPEAAVGASSGAPETPTGSFHGEGPGHDVRQPHAKEPTDELFIVSEHRAAREDDPRSRPRNKESIPERLPGIRRSQ